MNAIEAVKENSRPKISLLAKLENSKTVIKVMDNGKGIHSDILDKIFIPFFSTKKMEQASG